MLASPGALPEKAGMAADPTHRAIEAVFRIERARLIAGLARMTRDVDCAEELAQEALLAALTDWPASGVPDRPGAWLMAAAKRRAIDGFRRAAMQDRKQAEIARDRKSTTSELQSLMRISYAVFCLKKKKQHTKNVTH